MATTKVGLYKDSRLAKCWVVRWHGSPIGDTGKTRRPGKAFQRKRDAERYQAEKQAEFDKGNKRDRPPVITLGEFCDLYMNRRNHEWREKTRWQIVDVTNRLRRHFGEDRKLRSITAEEAVEFWAGARKIKPESVGEELSRYTKNRILRDTKTLFKYAVEWGYLPFNPLNGIKLLRVSRKTHKRWHYIQPREYMALLKAAPDLRWKCIYAVAYTCGLRMGELFSLTEDCVDLARERLIIKNREATSDLPPFHLKDHEDREIPLARSTARLLAGWLRVRPKGSPLILLTPERYERIRKRWQKHRKAGIPWVNDYLVNNHLIFIRRHAKWAGIDLKGTLTMHAFRKSCAQNWANHLPMNVVRELLGHADISTTAEFYSVVSPEHEVMANMLIQQLAMPKRQRNNAITSHSVGT